MEQSLPRAGTFRKKWVTTDGYGVSLGLMKCSGVSDDGCLTVNVLKSTESYIEMGELYLHKVVI